MREVERCFLSPFGPGILPKVVKNGPRKLVGAVVPHAGLIFSGPVAAHLYSEMAKDGLPETVVIIGPNHTGYGRPMSVCGDDFETPMGTVKVDKDIISRLRGVVELDRTAHMYEHSLEVQLPFLQYLSPDIKIVPMVMGQQDIVMATESAKVLREACIDKDVMYIASSDLSHYVPAALAKEKDGKVIERILSMDAEGVIDTVNSLDVSMCGYGPVATMMLASGGRGARLLHYGSSGDIRPMHDIVGYASIAIYR